jgi:preprotein translocase subunit YajC
MTVEVTADTTIRKQVSQTLADIKPGATVFALGQQNGAVVQARQIRLGVTPGAGRPNGGNGRQGGNGTPRPATAPGGVTVVAGTVDSVSGDTVTVKSATGTSVQVQLLANGQVTAQENGTIADITAGKFLVAVGPQQGTTVTASTVNVTDAPPAGNDPNASASG